MEHTVNSDAGAQIRDGVKSVADLGVCPETEWPYDINKFADKPTPKCYTDAKKCEAVGYQRLDSTNLNQLKGCIASGFPFVFGFTVYDAFESPEMAKTVCLEPPTRSERESSGWPRGARSGLRRRSPAFHGAQFLGKGLGHQGLLHDPLHLPDHDEPRG